MLTILLPPLAAVQFLKRAHSLALVPLKSPSLASISSSPPSVAFSITLLPPDLRGGAKDAGSFPLLQLRVKQ